MTVFVVGLGFGHVGEASTVIRTVVVEGFPYPYTVVVLHTLSEVPYPGAWYPLLGVSYGGAAGDGDA